ncbi:hypothetical protein TWF730_008956 [Orbilia blumenaviensis]|uniref:Apple domain-containing protein n=1 Tax=Orbilia blumenaviensis TaxID=1796055 RepID=A0AAV9UXU8_9PEZI
MSLKSLLILAAFAATSQALPEGLPKGFINRRSGSAGCNADNALRNLRDKRYSSSASLFCSEWLQSTLTNTLQITATASATATETPEPITVTVPETVTITNIETTYQTEYPTAVNTFVKRGEIGYPAWLSATYPASRVSSACSCFIESPSPAVTETFTTTVATVTNTATTTLGPLTATETSFATATASATETVTITGPSIACGIIGCVGIPGSQGFLDQTYAEIASPPDGVSARTIQECKNFCLSTSGCVTYQFGLDAVGGFVFCNVFSLGVDVVQDSGSASDPTCQWTINDLRCLV